MIYYITSVKIPAVNAQSVQIHSNAIAFSELLNGDFLLVSPSNQENNGNTLSWWKQLNCFFKSGRFKYIEFALRSLFIKVNKEDAVYTRDILIAYLFSFTGCNVVYEAHQKPSHKASFIINKLKQKKAKFICISKALKHYFVGQYAINERNILVAHDGVFIEDYQNVTPVDLKSEFNIPKDNKVLLHTGSLYKGRGAELFEGILNKFPEINIVHIGGSEENVNYWLKQIAHPRFSAKSHVSNNELVRYQKSTDILLYPMTRATKTYWCCSPMKIFEYLASEKPIISTSIGSITEIMNKSNAFLFDPELTSTLYSSITECLSDESVATKKAKQGYSDVKSNYTWAARVISILTFIKDK